MEDATFERGIRYIYYKNNHLSPAARQFIALLDRANIDPKASESLNSLACKFNIGPFLLH